MKKFIYVAVMAIAVVFASCKSESNSSEYYKNHELQIDINAGTVNGVVYDNTTDKCWKTTITTKTFGISSTVVDYEWGTQFSVVAGCETAMAAVYAVKAIGNSKATYTCVEAPEYDTYEKCADAHAAATAND